MKKRVVWIVEANYQAGGRLALYRPDRWHPTVGIGLTRVDAERAVRDWRARNPDDLFRVQRYVRSRP